MTVQPWALGVYIFAGGFTCGVRRHLRVTDHLEDGPFGTVTAENNLGIKAHIDPDTWPIEALKRRPGPLLLLYGNPPCAAWSYAGRSTYVKDNWLTDERVDCTRRLFKLLQELKPLVWVWESVPPTFKKAQPMIQEMEAKAAELGYQTSYVLHDLTLLGVAQRRRRFLCIFHKIDLDWDHELKRFNGLVNNGFEPVTVKQSLTGIDPEYDDPIGASLKKYASHVKPGSIFRRCFDKLVAENVIKDLGTRQSGSRVVRIGRPGFLVRRSHPDKPSSVVLGGRNIVHHEDDRYLTTNELAAICGFPRDYEFDGSISQQVAQVGKGVSPATGEWLAQLVKRSYELNPNPTDKTDTRVLRFFEKGSTCESS